MEKLLAQEAAIKARIEAEEALVAAKQEAEASGELSDNAE